jgi:hypothetical protein
MKDDSLFDSKSKIPRQSLSAVSANTGLILPGASFHYSAQFGLSDLVPRLERLSPAASRGVM